MSFILKTAIGNDFVDREEIINPVIKNFQDKNNMTGYAFIGVRRIGKSSILLEMERILKGQAGIVPIYFSIWDLTEGTIEEFCRKYYLTVIESFKKELSLKYKLKNILKITGDKIYDLLKAFDVNIKIFDEISLSISKKELDKNKIIDTFEKVLMLSDELAHLTKTKCILFIDEFPSIIELKIENGKTLNEQVIKKIRTINEKYKKTVLNIAGSYKKSMQLVALNSGSPFYRQFDIINVKPFSVDSVHLLLKKNLNKNINKNVSKKMFDLTFGIPFYVQAIGKGLLIERKQNENAVIQIFNRFIEQEGNIIFREEFNQMSTVEKKIILKMAKENITKISEISRAITEDMNITGRFLEYLINKGFVYKEERGIYNIEDPVFKEWLKRI